MSPEYLAGKCVPFITLLMGGFAPCNQSLLIRECCAILACGSEPTAMQEVMQAQLTLGTHTQRGLQYSVCVCVYLSAAIYLCTTGYEVAYTNGFRAKTSE